MTSLQDVQARWEAIAQRRGGVAAAPVNGQSLHLSEASALELGRGLEQWRTTEGVECLWSGASSLWTQSGEEQWLGWLMVVAQQLQDGVDVASSVREGLEDEILKADSEKTDSEKPDSEKPDADQPTNAAGPAVVLLGMGGSSLGPEVLAKMLACRWPLFVLDTTDPGQIARIESQLDLTRTLFVVSSKSGTTLETNLLFDYFFERVGCAGVELVGRRFVAVTDHGSQLDDLAKERGLRAVYYGDESIGGRYSVLSNFGLVPSAALGIDTTRLLEATVPMARQCAELENNPGLELGLVLGQAALDGRDKVTVLAPDALSGFGAWVEQLLAESTGKHGKGVIPVDLEAPMGVDRYGDDRLFVSLEMADIGSEGSAFEAEQREPLEERLLALQQAGHPVVRITLGDEYSVGQEFFRWQFATAVMGAVLAVNPFDQPDVEASKIESRRLTETFEQCGSLPEETPFAEGARAAIYVDAWNRRDLRLPAEDQELGLADILQSHLSRIAPGDYFAILAYMDRRDEVVEMLQSMRGKVAQQLGVATCLGFGPRFLHSTGQAYKGGQNSGVFLQLTHQETADLVVPGRSFTFGVAKSAQARGDFEVMAERHRRILRVHFHGRLVAGLQRLDGLLGRSLQAVRERG